MTRLRPDYGVAGEQTRALEMKSSQSKRISVYSCQFVSKTFLAVVGAAALSSSPLAAAPVRGDDAARDAAIQWLQLIDAGRNEEAASQASTETRPFEQWLNHLKRKRAPLGKLMRRQFISMKHQSTFPSGFQVREYYVVRFQTSFAAKPSAIEEVVITKIGCCWEVFEYKVE